MKIASRAEKVKASSTLAITARAKEMKAGGTDVVSFSAGEPDFDTPEHIREAGIEAIKSGATRYTPASGIPELKKAVVEKLRRDNGLAYAPSRVVISCGAKHSLYNVIQVLVEEGDEVIIPSPYWVSYPEMVALAGGVPKAAETPEDNGFKLTEESLAGAITGKTRALILNSPSNPTGSVYSREELEMVARVTKKNGIVIVSDEIYEKIVYPGSVHVSVASLNEEVFGRTVVVNGVSKSYAMTGWRIGYLAAPEKIAGAVSRMQSHSTSNPASVSQRAALAALSGDQSCVEKMTAEFLGRRDYMVERIGKIEGISCRKPDGAFYVFCDVSAFGMAPSEFARRLLEEAGVALIPGEGFGSDRHIRLSFACGTEEITKGMDRIEKWVKQLPKKS